VSRSAVAKSDAAYFKTAATRVATMGYTLDWVPCAVTPFGFATKEKKRKWNFKNERCIPMRLSPCLNKQTVFFLRLATRENITFDAALGGERYPISLD